MLDADPVRFGFEAKEVALFRKLSSPEKIQRFLDEQVRYHSMVSCRSPRRLMLERKGHCMEGAMFAATALRLLGFPPLIVDMEAHRDNDHVIAVFRRDGLWGAVAKSNFAGMRYREPVYRTVRELVMSYFEHYFNARGERTLRAYSRPINLSQFDHTQWMTTLDDPWHIPCYLTAVGHTPLFPRKVVARLTRLDPVLKAAGKYGMRRAG